MVITVPRVVGVILITQTYATQTMARAPADQVGMALTVHWMWTNALMRTCTLVLQTRPVIIQKEPIDANVTLGLRNLDLYA